MAFLTAEQILVADDVKTEVVSVPEWGGEVRVRGAMANEMDEYEQTLVTTKFVDDKAEVVSNSANAKARLVVKLIVDGNGNRIFNDSQAEDIGRKSHAAVNRLFQKIQELSGRTRKAQGGLEKNLGGGPTTSSGTPSSVISADAQSPS